MRSCKKCSAVVCCSIILQHTIIYNPTAKRYAPAPAGRQPDTPDRRSCAILCGLVCLSRSYQGFVQRSAHRSRGFVQRPAHRGSRIRAQIATPGVKDSCRDRHTGVEDSCTVLPRNHLVPHAGQNSAWVPQPVLSRIRAEFGTPGVKDSCRDQHTGVKDSCRVRRIGVEDSCTVLPRNHLVPHAGQNSAWVPQPVLSRIRTETGTSGSRIRAETGAPESRIHAEFSGETTLSRMRDKIRLGCLSRSYQGFVHRSAHRSQGFVQSSAHRAARRLNGRQNRRVSSAQAPLLAA